MKNKKGFTLVEIIVVVAILVVIAGIFSVNMIRSLNKNKDEENKNVVTTITSAAEAYVSANPEKVERLYNGYGYVDIEVGELRDEGFLKEDLKDVETGEKIPDEAIVRVRFDVAEAMSFTYPISEEEKNIKAWELVADPLTIEYDSKTTSEIWCKNRQNLYRGLYDSNYVIKNNWNEVNSRLYLVDNSEEGKIFDRDYFTEAKLEATSCNVNPQVAGTYNITYKYVDPDLKIEKTQNREVYVRTNANDVISFTAEINHSKKIILNAKNVPVTIVEKYKDGKTSNPLEKSAEELDKIGYKIEGFYTNEAGTRTAIVSSIKTNSDGSRPEPQKPPYTVTDSLVEIVNESEKCTPNNSSTCYLKCAQDDNYVEYKGQKFRIYGMTGNTVKIIYDGNDIVAPYGQVGSCTNNSCCNGGRYIYNQLGQTMTANVPYTKMDVTLNGQYYNRNYASKLIYPQRTETGYMNIALLTLSDYIQISSSCSTNYLTGTAFWLLESAGSVNGAGNYNKGRNAAYAYNYAVDASGKITTSGASKPTTVTGDYGVNNVMTDRLVVKPTLYLSNPSVSKGTGTYSDPYIIKFE